MKEKFPNGFDDWLETFYGILDRLKDISDNENINNYRENYGYFSDCDLARKLTNEFEKKYLNYSWGYSDLLYFDAIDEFVESYDFTDIVNKINN